MSDDRSIIEGLNRRDESALQAIRQQYGTYCHNLAYRILESHEDAEECVDDMLMAVWDSIPPQHPDSLQAYLITIVRRVALSRYRHEHRQKRGGGAFTTALDELSDILPSDEHLEDTIEQRELSRALQSFLLTLKADTRRAFLRRYFLSEPVQTIAETLGTSQSAIKMALHRTRKKLKAYLEKEGLL